MKEARQNFLVGLFALVGIGILGALVVLFGQAGFWTRTAGRQQFKILFDQASGIRDGTLVTVGGLTIGRVSDSPIFADENDFGKGVYVPVLLEPGHKLRVGSRAATSAPGLGMGRPPIVIYPGSPENPELGPDAVIRGDIGSAVESLIPSEIVDNFDKTARQIERAAAALTPVLEDLHQVLMRRESAAVDMPGGPQGNLSSAIERFDSTLKHLNDVLGDGEVKSKVRASIDNLHTMTEDGKAMFGDLKAASQDVRETATQAKDLVAKTSGAVERIDANADRLARAMTNDLELASQILTRLNALAARTERGEGTIGRLFTDERLYESMVLTFRRLSETVEEFRLLIKQWQEGKIKIAV